MRFFGLEISRAKVTPLPKTEDLAAKPEVKADTNDTQAIPTSGGRSSMPDSVSLMSLLQDEVALIKPEYAIEFIKALEHLGMHNADVSYAVDNIVQLGATEFDVFFDDKVSDDQKNEMMHFLKMRYKGWYGFNEGLGSLIRDLLAQVAITGALSAEIVPNNSLTGVKKIVLVTPRNIRFLYDNLTDTHKPYQNINGIKAAFGLKDSVAVQGLKELNPVTYKYAAIRRFNENPYAVPPFLSAIENICIERDMMTNFRLVIKNLGLLGFLNVMVTAPKPMPGELDPAYQERMKAYMASVAASAGQALSKGFIVGEKNTQDIKMENTSANATDAEKLFNMNEKLKLSGLKQDPLMMGRNYSTTETLGRVILTKMGSQIVSYQEMVASFLESAFMMDLLLAGFPVSFLEVVFAKPLLSDVFKDAQAETAKLANLTTLYNQGIISQEDYAQEAGYEQADQPKPREPVLPAGVSAKGAGNPSNKGADVSNNTRQLIAEAVAFLNDEDFVPEFDYTDGCTHTQLSDFKKDYYNVYKLSKNTDLLAEYLKEYFDATEENYEEAVFKVSKQVANVLAEMPAGSTLQHVLDASFAELYTKWGKTFSQVQRKTTAKYVDKAYRAFKKDKSIFNGAEFINGNPVPEATFGLLDIRAIEYYKKSDNLYLGKFITDEDTKKKLTAYIKKAYLEENTPIGKGKEGIDKFRKEFAEVLSGEDWKISRILNTTVNHMRNVAAVNYMQEAEVVSFRIVGVVDSHQCSYCKALQGRTFNVTLASTQAERMVSTGPGSIGEVRPFVGKVFKNAAEMAALTDEAIQKSGIALPAYHPSCRDVIVADI